MPLLFLTMDLFSQIIQNALPCMFFIYVFIQYAILAVFCKVKSSDCKIVGPIFYHIPSPKYVLNLNVNPFRNFPPIQRNHPLNKSFCQFLIHFHKFCYAATFRHSFHIKSVSLHYRSVILLMSFTQFWRHSEFIIQVGKRAIGI